jgi:uncharacterized protein
MKALAYVVGGALGVVLLLILWGVVLEPRLIDEEHYMVALPHLPPAWHGRQIALIADLQVGMWLANTDTIRRLVARLVECRRAAVLIAGDFIYQPLEEEPEEAVEEFEPTEYAEEALKEIRVAVALVRPLLEAGIPTYAVLGNHDYGMAVPTSLKLPWLARRLREALEAAGVQVLHNEAVALAPPKADEPSARGAEPPLYLVGIGAHYAHEDRPLVALAQVPEGAPRLLLMHHPDIFAQLPAGTAPLALAGHTHGGQVRLPFLPEWSWLSFLKEDEVHVDGWIHSYGQPGNRLYVNRGIGFSLAPIRINCPPELTIFTLR